MLKSHTEIIKILMKAKRPDLVAIFMNLIETDEDYNFE
mgnify:CR=1 FL=1|tara:strand:+ start:275 stop:388 length:114 start_codon:yes stop_codon:yes gene_type:complete